MKTILTPIDFSKISDAVVQEAISLARGLDARIVLLTVVQPPAVMTEYAAMIDVTELTAAGERNAARQLEAIEQKLKADFLQVRSVQVSGPPVSHIIEQAAECDADYIVMGSHGHTAFYDLLVGSTTHGVLNRAKCPVVIVPANQAAMRARPAAKEAMSV